MSDRHYHCVYFQYLDPTVFDGYCILKNKQIERGYEQCCENIVLKPSEVITYFLKHKGYCEDWACATDKAIKYVKQVGFNNYPKGDKND